MTDDTREETMHEVGKNTKKDVELQLKATTEAMKNKI